MQCNRVLFPPSPIGFLGACIELRLKKECLIVTPQDIWNAAKIQLELQFDRASYDTWLRATEYLDFVADDSLFVISVPNAYIQDMLQNRLYRNIRRVLCGISGGTIEMRFDVVKHEIVSPLAGDNDDMPLFKALRYQDNPFSDSSRDVPSIQEALRTPRFGDLPESIELNPNMTFERFIVNRSNEMAYQAARAVAEFHATVYNPYLVYSSTGLGKTHLLQAIAHECVRRGLKTLYVTSDVFTTELMTAIRNRTTAMFQQKYRTVDVLLMDDVQFIAGKESTQEEFFHTFNALKQANRQIIMTSDRHPETMLTLDDRLRSRFSGGLIADIAMPEYETRRLVLEMWAKERETIVTPDTFDMLAKRGSKNFRELEGLFLSLVAQSKSAGLLSSDPERIERAIELFQSPRKQVNMPRIIEITAQKYGLCAEDLTGNKRTASINTARQVAMYIARDLTPLSLSQIGEVFSRNHTTVLHGCNKVADDLNKDAILRGRIEYIKRILES